MKRLLAAAAIVLAGAAHASPAFLPAQEPGRQWAIRDALPGVRLQNPLFAVIPPGDPSVWFVGEREGRVLAVPRREGATARVVLDLRAQTLGWQDAGLLNLAFHPEFGKAGSSNRGHFYVWYNHTQTPHPGPDPPFLGHPSSNRLSRFTIPDGSGTADPRSERVLIEQHRTNTDHQGGGLFFHPGDGFLYIGVGDGGHPYAESRGSFVFDGTDDPQRIDRDLLSGVLRIDVDCRGGAASHPIRRQPRHGRTQGYCIPSDNPWLDPRGGVLEEFFAIGIRSPHRMTYDPVTQRIFAGDVGEGRAEEIDVIERGGNYQWKFLEGAEPYAPRPAQVLGVERGPLVAYRHPGFNSVIGGFVYRGRAYAELSGRYVFGDTGSGWIWGIDAAASAPAVPTPLLRLPQEMTVYGGLSSFAVDEDGEIHLCILGNNEAATGSLQKLVRVPPSPHEVPATLSATGLFPDTAALVAARELFPYVLNTPFWSDHATKSRWLYVPPETRIGFRAEGEWVFPRGTVAVKHFDIELDENDPNRKRRLETRVVVLDDEGGAYGRIYKWRADQRDADLMTRAVTERLTRTSGQAFGPLQPVALGGQGAGGIETTTAGLVLHSPAGGTLFAHALARGDFDVAASWDEVADGAGGLLLKDALDEAAPYLFVAWEADARAEGGRSLRVERLEKGASAPTVTHAVVGGGPWIRLRRTETTVEIFTGADGHLWSPLAVPTPMDGLAGTHLGLAVRSPRGVARARVASHVRCDARDHYYPSNDECLVCHTRSAGFILGGRTRQWNLDVAGRNQLLLAHERGLFDTEIRATQPAGWQKLVALEDRRAPLAERVRSYLDANCAQCHRPGGVVQAGLDARYDTPLEKQGLIGQRLRWPPIPRQDEAVVTPRDPARSRLFTIVADHQMPPVGSALAHAEAADLLRTWILSLEGPSALPPVVITWSRADRGQPARIEITHADPLAVIHFTIDGTGPSRETARYTGPFELPGSAVIRAVAFRDGFTPARISTVAVPDRGLR